MIGDLLTKLDSDKDQWIDQAIDHYIEEYLLFKGQKYEKDQLLIGIHGRNEALKTAFILSILGVGKAEIAPLTHALRPKDSFFTCFIYKRSKDEKFHLIYPDKTQIFCGNLKELATELQTLRKQIVFGQVSCDKPIILEVANHSLTNLTIAEKSKRISIIDFPGDSVEDRDYKNTIFRAYIPLCSTTLVLESCAEMGRSLDQLKDWMQHSRNFRLVLTDSLQSEPLQSAIESGEVSSVEEMREFFLRNGVESSNPIFPLDIGYSGGNPPVKHKIQGWMDALFSELVEEITAPQTPENKIKQIKNILEGFIKQKNLEIMNMEKEIRVLREGALADKQSWGQSEYERCYLLGEVQFYEIELRELEGIQLEEFEFSYEDLKGQVAFKERKISRLKETFKLKETEMLEFYQEQIAKNSLFIKHLVQNVSSSQVDFHTNPPIVRLSLKHGKGLDQYLNQGNFEEDYAIVRETLEKNNGIIFSYYESQLNRFKEKGIKEFKRIMKEKENEYELAVDRVNEKLERITQTENSIMDIQEKLARERKEYGLVLEQLHKLDEMLKAKFVDAVTKWKEKMLAEQATDAERWAYHNYCQRTLKQAERIIRNDDF